MICSHRFSSALLGDLHLYSTWASLCYPSPTFSLGFGCPFDSSEQESLQEPSFPFLPLKSKREQIPGLLTRCAARSIEGEHSLNGDVHGGDVEGFKHDLKEQRRTEDYQKSQLSWPTEWLVILLRGGPVPVNPAPTSHGFWRGLHAQQVLKKTLLHWCVVGKKNLAKHPCVFLRWYAGLPGLLPGSSSPCWPWDSEGPPWAGWGVPQGLPAAHCRRSGARSGWEKSQMRPADSQWAGKFQLACPYWGRMAWWSQNRLDLERRPISTGNFWSLFQGYIPSHQGPRQDSDLGPTYSVCWLFPCDLGSSSLGSLVSPAPRGTRCTAALWLLAVFGWSKIPARGCRVRGGRRAGCPPGQVEVSLSTAPAVWPLFRLQLSLTSSLATLALQPSSSKSFPCCWYLGVSASLSGSLTCSHLCK